MEISTLPIFRVAGLSAIVSRAQAQSCAQELRAQWLANPPNLSAFSPTLYGVYQYIDADKVNITFGKLVSTDAALPDNMFDVWIAPQNYAVFTADDGDMVSIWAQIAAHQDLNRSFVVDLETYPKIGAPRVYVGLVGTVEISESDEC